MKKIPKKRNDLRKMEGRAKDWNMLSHKIPTATLVFTLITLTPSVWADETPESSDQAQSIELTVHRKRQPTDGNRTAVSQQDIQTLPQGDQAPLSQVVAETVPGAIGGPMGQLFFRGTYEASAQYQLDGIQLPDFATARFGQIFPTQAIERVDVLTGAFPAEYGERLGGVVNIITKSGTTEPTGQAEVKYGSYNTLSPSVSYGGATAGSRLHYFASVNYDTTSRGLNTPQPVSATEIGHGGEQAVHDNSQGNSEVVKLDWLVNDDDKLSFLFLNAHRFMQIPNFPSSFAPNNPLFTQGDSYGNPAYRYVPPYTNDTQTEDDNYVQGVWKHSFSDHAFLQVAPYWKGSTIAVGNDLQNDLAGVSQGQTYASFAENRTTNCFGAHADYTYRLDQHLLKSGLFIEAARTGGSFTVISAQDALGNAKSFTETAPVTQTQEAVYVQDDYKPWSKLTLSIGLRFNATQIGLSDGESPSDTSLQPRVGASYALSDTTVVHAYYGRLYHNAPAEDLRLAFSAVNGAGPSSYDVKSENADYYEAGLTQTWLGDQTAALTTYYRAANNWLDDESLPNTFLTQPVNFSYGYSEGVDVALHGPVYNSRMAYFLNYSYMQAKVKGLTGGVFTNPPGQAITTSYTNLDTAQTHTAAGGLMWRQPTGLWWSLQSIFGSGLPTSPDNSKYLPAHITFDASLGYEFKYWDQNMRVSGDVLNIFDDSYPININNGIIGSQYAAGRQFFVHLASTF